MKERKQAQTTRREFLSKGSLAMGFALFASSSLCVSCASKQKTARRFYTPRYNTITHSILELQYKHLGETDIDLDLALLDQIILEARDALSDVNSSAEDPFHRATMVFGGIHKVLNRCGFIYEPVRILSEGLKVRGVNCDGFSALYLAVGEALHYPIKMVRAPTHTFVRWVVDKNDYFNWETTNGALRSDEYYIRQHNIHRKSIGLSAMKSLDVHYDRDAILSNAFVNIGAKWFERGKLEKAEEMFLEARRRDSNFDTPCFNLGVVALGKGDLREAVEWCKRALDLNPNHFNARLILKTAYAKLGDGELAAEQARRISELNKSHFAGAVSPDV